MNDRVSLIIPVYNVEKYLRRCLNSVINQTYQNLEIIIINDGSMDGSQAIVDEYMCRDVRINSLTQKNQGVGIARNSGMKIASGNYLMFIDSDDYIEPECIEIMIYNARVTGADIVVANNKKRTNKVRNERRIEDKVLTEQEMRNPNWRFNYFIDPAYGITAWGKLYKHDFIKNTGIEFESNELIFSEDILFNCLLFTYNPRISLVNEYVYVYCINDGQITQSYRPRVSQRYLTLLQIFSDHLTKLSILDEYQDLIAFLCLRFISTCCYNEYKFSKNRYAAMKNHLTNLMQADILKISIRNLAQGKFIDDMNKRNKKTTRLQASLLNHHLIELVVILRMITYKLM